MNPEIPNPYEYALPRVSEEIISSLLADIREQGDDLVFQRAEERFSTNNSELYNDLIHVMHNLRGLDEGSEAMNSAYRIMVTTHELLCRQAEADALHIMVTPPEADTQT